MVVELLSLQELDEVQLAQVQERLEAAAELILRQMPTMERYEVAGPERFDPPLRQGLRLG
jgi:hypothetical protein